MFQIHGYLYRAVRQIAETNELINLKIENPHYPKEEFLSVINRFTNPVIIANITLFTLLELTFSKSNKFGEDCNYCFKTTDDDTKTFELYLNPTLSGTDTDFLIFDEHSFNCATIVKVNPLELL